MHDTCVYDVIAHSSHEIDWFDSNRLRHFSRTMIDIRIVVASACNFYILKMYERKWVYYMIAMTWASVGVRDWSWRGQIEKWSGMRVKRKHMFADRGFFCHSCIQMASVCFVPYVGAGWVSGKCPLICRSAAAQNDKINWKKKKKQCENRAKYS